MSEHYFEKEELIKILENVKDKTLGKADIKHVFNRAINNPKITGIAGDVIEQSVLGYPSDTKQKPDINVSGIPTEVKTTGIRKSKKAENEYEAKEPVSITAVSPEKIIFEDFYNSAFWHKLEHLLFIYYLYDSDTTVKAIDYSNFPILGYQFFEFNEEERNVLKNDWEIVRNSIKNVIEENKDKEIEYPKISKLRNECLMIDTAPKYPNNPRFRLKRSVVTNIYRKKFGDALEELPKEYISYREIDEECNNLTERFKGMTIEEIADILQINSNLNNKSIGQQIVVKMFGGTSKSMSDVDIFNKFGIIGKTIVVTSKGARTEDMKLFHVDFEEMANDYIHDEYNNEDREITFEDSFLFSYFNNYNFLCIIFEEPEKKTGEYVPLCKNKFVGFKRISFDYNFIDTKVKALWNDTRDKIKNNKLINVKKYKKDGTALINKSGEQSSAPNFIKSKQNDVFLRGSAQDSSSKNKIENINGISMLPQYVWIKGSTIVKLLNS